MRSCPLALSPRLRLAVGLGLLLVSRPLAAALPNADEKDFDFLAEHLLESLMDDRFAALPLAAAPGEGRWQPVVTLGYASTRADYQELSGPLFGVGAGYRLSPNRSLAAFGFFDQLDIGGKAAVDDLIPLFANDIPLDLPENAAFGPPRGEARHLGLGAAFTWRRGASTWSVGAIWSQLEARDFTASYRLLGGADAGVSGVLDHSASYSFLSPFARWRTSVPLGSRFALAPQVVVVVPLPRRGFAGRISGPGFAVAGDTSGAGHGVHVGDSYVGFGCEVEHLASHLSLELGAGLYQPLYERLVHAGLERAWVLHLVWRGGS